MAIPDREVAMKVMGHLPLAELERLEREEKVF
jgi:hypothetical protein